ncbi:polyprenyl synthetase family protein [Aquisalimonas sp.]|uniref:polyprenyl synthetase family protein n=1 Tax=Aquisalimonas sp. TaxID=1872621 RepID=UPI0025BEBC88|nr:polyprenyl synthetase family protein [Aquisalimonas sp.]
MWCQFRNAEGGRCRADQHHGIDAAAACELLHNASLVHDDLSDGDTVRRGQPTIWHLYGSDITLCTGDLSQSTSAFFTAANIDDPASSRTLVLHLAKQAGRVIGGEGVAREYGHGGALVDPGDEPHTSPTTRAQAGKRWSSPFCSVRRPSARLRSPSTRPRATPSTGSAASTAMPARLRAPGADAGSRDRAFAKPRARPLAGVRSSARLARNVEAQRLPSGHLPPFDFVESPQRLD